MRFEIEANPTGGLRIIHEIPDVGPICQIEGRNGVGKSMALRILELCTGTQPYAAADADSWASLRRQLGAVVVVRALNLAEGQSVEWRLNPAVWPERPKAVSGWLGTATIDGRTSTLEEAQGLIRVIHHSGELTLEGTIRARITRDRSAVRAVLDRFTQRERRIGEQLDLLRRDLERADFDQVRTLQSAVDVAREQAAEAVRVVELVRGQHGSLERALVLREQQARVAGDVPKLEERERELNKQVDVARERVRDVEAKYEEMRTRRRRDEAIIQEIEKVESLLKGRTKRAENARVRAVDLAAQSRLPAESNDVAQALAAVRKERDEVVRARDLVDATPRVRQLVEEVAARLTTQRAQALDDQVIARLDDTAVSVRGLREGVERRRLEFKDYQPEPPAAALEARIKTLTQRASLLSTLEEALEKARSAQQLVEQAQSQLTSLTSQLPADEATEYRQIDEQLDKVRNEHLNLVEQRALIRGQITEIVGGGREEGARELADLLGALGCAAGELESVLADRARELTDRLREQAVASAALTDAQRQVRLARAEFDQAVAILESGDEYGWLRSEGVTLPSSTLADDENGRRLKRLKTVVQSLEERFDSARDALRGLDGGLAAWEGPERLSDRSTVYGTAARNYYEAVFGREFSGREILDAIFDRGEFGRLDLEAMAVSWKTAEGELRTRPLAAFSSGERAFAYTRTRLQAIEQRAKNTVVALDEFGAYLARDRLRQLVEFLEKDILGAIADEVMIVLPLSRDYELELEGTRGSWHDEISRRVAELQERGYFVRAPDWVTV